MSALSAAQADAFELLCEDICVHLGGAEALAAQDDNWSADDIKNARELISDLVLGIRGLMIEHDLQSNGDCQTCTSPWPCSVITTIHGFVKDPHGQFIALVSRARDEG